MKSTPQPIPQSEPADGSISQPQANHGSRSKCLIAWAFTLGNICFSVLASAAGALGIGNANSVNDTSIVFVGLYLILFSAILVGYEVSQSKPGNALDLLVKKNLGFLYGPFGRSIYIIFMGFLAFGITNPRNLAIATGVLVGAWGLLQLVLAYMFPQFFDKKEKYVPQY